MYTRKNFKQTRKKKLLKKMNPKKKWVKWYTSGTKMAWGKLHLRYKIWWIDCFFYTSIYLYTRKKIQMKKKEKKRDIKYVIKKLLNDNKWFFLTERTQMSKWWRNHTLELRTVDSNYCGDEMRFNWNRDFFRFFL